MEVHQAVAERYKMKRDKSGYMKRSKTEKTSLETSVTIDAQRLAKMLGFDLETDKPVLDIIGFGNNIKIVLDNAKRKDFRTTVSWEKKIKK